MGDISFPALLKKLDETGWKEGYQKLKILHEHLENQQAFLFAEPATVKQAEKMSIRLARQDVTLKRIEIEARKKNIDIGDIHK